MKQHLQTTVLLHPEPQAIRRTDRRRICGGVEVKLSRAQRRQMQKLADRVDRVTQGDRRFFERFPQRQHRVRLASQAEIGQNEIVEGPQEVPPDCRIFTIVRNIAPGVRLRLFTAAPEGAETDLSEALARAIFHAAATPRTWEIESEMRKAAEARP